MFRSHPAIILPSSGTSTRRSAALFRAFGSTGAGSTWSLRFKKSRSVLACAVLATAERQAGKYDPAEGSCQTQLLQNEHLRARPTANPFRIRTYKNRVCKSLGMNTYTKDGVGVVALCCAAFEPKSPAHVGLGERRCGRFGRASAVSKSGAPKTGTRRPHGSKRSAAAFSAARSAAEVRQGLGSQPEMSPGGSQRLLRGSGLQPRHKRLVLVGPLGPEATPAPALIQALCRGYNTRQRPRQPGAGTGFLTYCAPGGGPS